MAGKDAKKEEGTDEKGGGKKKIIMIVPLVLLLAGGGWFFFLRGGGEETKELPPPVAGEMLEVEPITINQAGGHFLKLGMGLQVVEGAHAAPSSAKALDLAIAQFSGKSITELSSSAGREKNKQELLARIKLAYAPHTEEETTEETTSEKGAEESSEEEGSEEEHAEESGGHGAPLTAEQAIKAAEELTVQPDIYEVYFTEFVMQ
jgi:flagellar FliL protein